MNDDVLIVEKQAPLCFLKLNRPQVLNSLNTKLLTKIVEACNDLQNDRQTRVVIITGRGPKAFCAGADLAERKEMNEGQVLDYLALIQRTMLAIENLPQPVIAAINGPSFGGGCELALACDLRAMAQNAFLRLTEVRLGIIPGAGGTQRLSRLIGKSRAKEAILCAKPIAADEALSIGLAHKVVPEASFSQEEYHQELLATVAQWAQGIAEAAPLSLAAAKAAIDQGFDRDLSAGLAIETKAYLGLVNTADRKEGLAAFAEKRSPVYVGN